MRRLGSAVNGNDETKDMRDGREGGDGNDYVRGGGGGDTLDEFYFVIL